LIKTEILIDFYKPLCTYYAFLKGFVSTSSIGEPRQRKRSRKDPPVEVIGDISSSLKDFWSFLKEYFIAMKN
jgi:hypothetical protein